MKNVTERSTHGPDVEQLTLQQIRHVRFAQQAETGANGKEHRQRVPASDLVANELMLRRIMGELLNVE